MLIYTVRYPCRLTGETSIAYIMAVVWNKPSGIPRSICPTTRTGRLGAKKGIKIKALIVAKPASIVLRKSKALAHISSNQETDQLAAC
jgi:hypothetical protein